MSYTESEKAEWVAKMRGLARKIGEMTEAQRADMAREMPIVTCEGHVLSIRNQCVLQLQAGARHLTMIAGYRQWAKVGRTVRKGETACGYIMAPLAHKSKDAKGETAADHSDRVHFRFVAVFDVTQTEETYTPEPKQEPTYAVNDAGSES